MNPSTTGLTIRFISSPRRSHSLLRGESSAGAARVMTRNTMATINDHQRIAWPETSGHTPITRNTTVNTQPKPRLLDDLTAWVLEKSSCVAMILSATYRRLCGNSALAADHHVQTPVASAGEQHVKLAREEIEVAARRPGTEQLRILCELLASDRRNREQQLDAGTAEPLLDLSHRMAAFVGMLILVHEPCRPAPGVQPAAAQSRVECGPPIPEGLYGRAPP